MLNLKTEWSPTDIKSRLGNDGGIGFVFHATDWDSIQLAFENQVFPESELWDFGPFICSPIFETNRIIGCHIATPLPPELWLGTLEGIREFRNIAYQPSLKLAEECGLSHIGLAALIPFATKYGRLPAPSFKGAKTTGHAATVATILQVANKVCSRASIRLCDTRFAVFGAAGSIGSNTARWFAENGVGSILLVDLPKKQKTIQAICESLNSEFPNTNAECCDASSILEFDFDIGIVATNAAKPWMGQEVLEIAPVWIDDSHPRAAAQDVIEKAGVAYLECCLLAPHGVSQTFPFRLPTTRHCFPCFAEVYLCWKEKMQSDFVLGRATLEQIRLMDSLLEQYVFVPAINASKCGGFLDDQVLRQSLTKLSQQARRNAVSQIKLKHSER